MTNEQSARIIVDFDTDERCIGCGDFLSYCDSVDCLAIVGRHESGDHGSCDILVCAAADIAAYNEGRIQDPFYSVYIPAHKLGEVAS